VPRLLGRAWISSSCVSGRRSTTPAPRTCPTSRMPWIRRPRRSRREPRASSAAPYCRIGRAPGGAARGGARTSLRCSGVPEPGNRAGDSAGRREWSSGRSARARTPLRFADGHPCTLASRCTVSHHEGEEASLVKNAANVFLALRLTFAKRGWPDSPRIWAWM